MFSCSIWTYTFKLEMWVTVAVCAVGEAGSVDYLQKALPSEFGEEIFKKLFYKMTYFYLI